MLSLYISVFLIAVFNLSALRYKLAGIAVIYWIMLAVVTSNLFVFAQNQFVIKKCKTKTCMWWFIGYACLIVTLSYFGIMQRFASSKIYIDLSFIPRQAYYLVFFPTIYLLYRYAPVRRLDCFVRKHSHVLFFIIYFGHMLYRGDFKIFITAQFVLSWLALIGTPNKHALLKYLEFAILILTPVASGGELTNLAIRAIYATCFLHRRFPFHLKRMMLITMSCMIASVFILSMLNNQVVSEKMDANSRWRMSFWSDEINELKQSKYRGVGFGTAYASTDFSGKIHNAKYSQFQALDGYTEWQRRFVMATHNSYIAIAFRLGVIGIVLFLLFLYKVAYVIPIVSSPEIGFAFYAAIFMIGVNVGLESPNYLILFIFSISGCVRNAGFVGESLLFKKKGMYEYRKSFYINDCI